MLEPEPKNLHARSLKFEFRLHSSGFNKSFKRNCTISTGIPKLGVWCKKMIQFDPRSRKKTSDCDADS